MDFYLRCNSLKCRSQLKERAVVTTCSHIFCLQCADQLGLSHPTGERRCPACQCVLGNPDDAVSTILNPTEDYKTSVLSGMDPTTIMECAGRALAFWSYQTTQEVFYQEFLGKTLTEKYTVLSAQMDKVILNANSEISTLQAKLSDMQNNQTQLHKKNQELIDLYRDKNRKYTQITNLYNILKSRAMRTQMQTAATDSVSRTLESLGPVCRDKTTTGNTPDVPQTPRPSAYPAKEGVEQLHRYQRSGTGSSKGAKGKRPVGNMPPPTRPVVRNAENAHRTRLPPSRPSTALSQLPTDRAMLERFRDAPSGQYGLLGTERGGDQGRGDTGARSALFDRIII